MSTSVATPIVHPTTPLDANQFAQQQFDRIADRLGLDQAARDLLRSPMRELAERGIVVVPAVLANAGGVTASYFEQEQSNAGH